MRVTFDTVLSFEPPCTAEDHGRWRVTVGNGKDAQQIGWVGRSGFYLCPSLPCIVLLSPIQLDSIAQQIVLMRKNAEKKK